MDGDDRKDEERGSQKPQKQEQSPLRLLNLPAELQLQIFELAVCSDGPIKITGEESESDTESSGYDADSYHDSDSYLFHSVSNRGDPESYRGDAESSLGGIKSNQSDTQNGEHDDGEARLEAADGTTNTPDQSCAHPRSRSTQPALASACRIVRADALRLYYSRNRFKASYCHCPKDEDNQEHGCMLVEWLRCIGAVNRSCIANLELSDLQFQRGVYVDQILCGRVLWNDHCLEWAMRQLQQPVWLSGVNACIWSNSRRRNSTNHVERKVATSCRRELTLRVSIKPVMAVPGIQTNFAWCGGGGLVKGLYHRPAGDGRMGQWLISDEWKAWHQTLYSATTSHIRSFLIRCGEGSQP
ncbi:hypothetical protein LTR74_010859 [Friedmanniomyces endolithicus]|nr:hypothetical protein LTR74_010859 [Friedmanniomyces endolithicus]